MIDSKVVGLVLIVVGVVGLAYGGLTYTSDRQDVQVGSMSIQMSTKRTVPVPLWAGIAALVVGGGLVFRSGKGS